MFYPRKLNGNMRVAGTSTSYSWGNSISSTDANWDYGSDPTRPVDVGLFAPNNWGFHDMHGNVYGMGEIGTVPIQPHRFWTL